MSAHQYGGSRRTERIRQARGSVCDPDASRYHGTWMAEGQTQPKPQSVAAERMSGAARPLLMLGLLVFAVSVLIATWPEATEGHSPKTDINVRAYGARGDGRADDTGAFVRAMRVAVGSQRRLYVPAGVYRVSHLSLPNGLSLRGAGAASTWLKGRLDFGSNQVIRNLKIGDYGSSAVHNKPGARNTVFEDCRFRGGGGKAWTYVVWLGSDGSCSNITFRRCDVECNLGSENSSMTNGFNDVTIWCDTDSAVTDVLFEGCHIGVSNGVRSGAPRMGVECYTDSGSGWQRITFRNCVVEVCDAHGMDFSDEYNIRSEGLVVEGCTLKGGGKAGREWGSTIDLEYPLRAVIRNNTFGLGWERCVQMTTRSDPYNRSYTVFTGNRVDLTPNGVTRASYWTDVDVTSDSPWGPSNVTAD